MIALGEITPQTLQIIGDLVRFYAFRRYRQPNGVRHGDDCLYNGGVLGILTQAGDKGTVNFERIHRKAFEITEARVSCAKVVDGQLHALFFQLL